MRREEIVSLRTALKFLARGNDRDQRKRLAVILLVMAVCESAVAAAVVWAVLVYL
jgi:hypothetical protein